MPELSTLSPATDLAPSPPQTDRLWPLDALRLLAMACVALRHAISISGQEAVPLPRYLGLGIFAVLSGYLAARSREPDSLAWLGGRLARFYIPYWFVLAAMLAANACTGYKPVSLGLVISQAAGSVAFTHPGLQLGIHTWYVSLLLMTSLLAVFVRRHPVWLVALYPLVCLSLWGSNSSLQGCVVAFLTGMACGVGGTRWWLFALAALASAGLGVVACSGFLYAAYGCAALALGLPAPARVPSGLRTWLARLGGGTYEFFLVHGPIFLSIGLLGAYGFAPILLAGTVLSIAASLCLRWVSQPLTLRLRRWTGLRGSVTCTGSQETPRADDSRFT